MTNVAQMPADSVATHGDRPAIKLDDIVLSLTAPWRLWLVDELPKGPTGKVLKREIRAPDD